MFTVSTWKRIQTDNMWVAIVLTLHFIIAAGTVILLILENKSLSQSLIGRDRYIAALEKYSKAMQGLNGEQAQALKASADLIAAQKTVILAYNPNFDKDMNNLKRSFN